MKSILFLKIALLAAVILTSCTKDNEPEPSGPNNPESGPFVAKVDNQAFPTADIQFTSARFISSTKMLQITGQPADRKETIVLTLMPFGNKVATAADWEAATYDFDPVHVSNVEYLASAKYNKYNGNGYDQWFTSWNHVKTGNIIIQSNTGTKIKGTFFFDAVQKNSDGSYNTSSIKKITAGAFDLNLTTL